MRYKWLSLLGSRGKGRGRARLLSCGLRGPPRLRPFLQNHITFAPMNLALTCGPGCIEEEGQLVWAHSASGL